MQIDGKRVGKGEILLKCPMCNKEKLYWNETKEVGFCHYCAKSVVGTRNLKKLFDTDAEPTWGDSAPLARLTSMAHEATRSNQPAWVVPRARWYLRKRQVDKNTAEQAGLKYCVQTEELLVPLCPVTVEAPAAHQKRRLSANGQAGVWLHQKGVQKSYYVIGQNLIPSCRRRAVLVEGAFDALGHLAGHAVCVLGTSLSDTVLVHLADRYEEVLLWFDPDNAGIAGAKKAERALSNWGVRCSNIYTRFPDLKTEPGDTRDDHPAVAWARDFTR